MSNKAFIIAARRYEHHDTYLHYVMIQIIIDVIRRYEDYRGEMMPQKYLSVVLRSRLDELQLPKDNVSSRSLCCFLRLATKLGFLIRLPMMEDSRCNIIQLTKTGRQLPPPKLMEPIDPAELMSSRRMLAVELKIRESRQMRSLGVVDLQEVIQDVYSHPTVYGIRQAISLKDAQQLVQRVIKKRFDEHDLTPDPQVPHRFRFTSSIE